MKVASAPDDIVETHEQGALNEREPLLVLGPLRGFLDGAGLEAPADLSAMPFGDGHSNVTYALSTGVVLRRPPRGPLPPSAHDVLREARVLRALEDTDVRTPRVLAVCHDESVIGAPFYVMEEKHGDVITTTMPTALGNPEQRRLAASELIDALVELHSVDYTQIGLDGFGKPTGYLERQLRRFNGLWDHNKTREIPEFERVSQWLAANIPRSPPATIVHGDYRLGNTMFAPRAPARLIAIFDWEMATIGDPLADIGYMMLHWRQADDPSDSKFNLQSVTTEPGFPTRRELVALYEHRSGRRIQQLDWYVVLALWKAVAFMEGNYKRALAGSTDDPYLKSFGDGVIELAQRALDVTRKGF
jgi:aminoglycoside phosphotransferase (APT) family kinase protein